MSRLVLKNGLLVGPDGATANDVAIEDGTIVELGQGLEGGQVIDCDGAWVGPGLVDLHVHFREPGQEWKEDIASGSAAAAAGGFTAVVAMPNTVPAADSGHVARHIIERGKAIGLVDVLVAGAVSIGRKGERLAHLDDLWKLGVRMFSDDGDTVADAGLLRKAMEYIGELGGVISQHAEDPGLARGGHMHEGTVSARLGMAGLPAVAEEAIVARDLRLVELTGCRYHVQHASTAGTVDLVRQAKAAGLPVTAEVAPHHLAFDQNLVLAMDSVAKMYPPLRTADDVAALAEALADGTIDCVATDHAPHSANEKDVPFEEAPRGVIGLETSAAVINTEIGLDPVAFFTRMSVAPAAILDAPEQGRWPEVGGPAHLAVFHPGRRWTVATPFASRAANTPWLGRELIGQVLATVYRGDVTHLAGEAGR